MILTGGGTGGHIYPATAIASQLKEEVPDAELLYIGSRTGLEKEIVAKEHIPFEEIEVSGFRRRLSWQNVRTVWHFLNAVRRCRKLIRQFRPDAVVGTGGYVCGPVVYAASRMGIPTLIHEQNAIPGLTNRFLGRFADCVAVSFDGSEKQFPNARKVVVTGNPRATAVVNADAEKGRRSLKIPEGAGLVLVVGGSRGARALNEVMVEMVRFLSEVPEVHFVYVTGKPYFEQTMRRIREYRELPANLHVVPYLHNMPDVLSATSLIISRSGASSLAEITALGIPSILIPSPNVTNNHQEANARMLADQGAAVMFTEKELSGDRIFASVQSIIADPVKAEHMSRQSMKMGRPDAARRVCREIVRLSSRKR